MLQKTHIYCKIDVGQFIKIFYFEFIQIKQFQVSSDIQSTGQLRWFGEISRMSCKKKKTKQNNIIHHIQVLNVEKTLQNVQILYMWRVKCKYEMFFKNNQPRGQQQECLISHMEWIK